MVDNLGRKWDFDFDTKGCLVESANFGPKSQVGKGWPLELGEYTGCQFPYLALRANLSLPSFEGQTLTVLGALLRLG